MFWRQVRGSSTKTMLKFSIKNMQFHIFVTIALYKKLEKLEQVTQKT